MDDVLGYDCDHREIYEYMILRGIWTNDIDISELPDTDPRLYCAVCGEDGNSYAISVYDWWYAKEIREREKIPIYEKISAKIKPISEMENYEIAYNSMYGSLREWYYTSGEEIKAQLNKELRKAKKGKRKVKKYEI